MEIDIRQILLQILNFGVLFAVLAKFLFRPILKILDERSGKIAEGLATADKNREAEEKLEKKSAEVLKKAEVQASKLLDEARLKSQKLAKDLATEARVEAQKAGEQEREAQKARLEDEARQFKSRMANLVATATKQVLTDSLSAGDIEKITKKELAQLKKLS